MKTGPASAVALVLTLCVSVASGDPPCRPGAALVGDRALTEPLGQLLAAHGVAAAVPGCAAVEVRVERREGGLSLHVRDTANRASVHDVGDLDVAAALVESWARTDISGALMMPAEASPHLDTTATAQAVLSQTARAPSRGLSLVVGGETSLGSDNSVWIGAQVSGCVRIGGFCVGATARYAEDTLVEGDAEAVAASRRGAELLLTADLPYHVGRAVVSPGLAAGVGWLRSSGASHDPLESSADIDSGGLRANAHAALAIHLTGRLSIHLGMSLDLAPLAHTAPFHTDGSTLPGEPRGYLRVVAGLQLGDP